MICQQCSKEIEGAAQKRFCDDACRMRYNRQNPNKENEQKNTNSNKEAGVSEQNNQEKWTKEYIQERLVAAIHNNDENMIRIWKEKLNDIIIKSNNVVITV